MRIISQNGAFDVPYEMSAIRNDDKLIILNMVGETGKGNIIARYSTSKKAEKAMEMLREQYSRLQVLKILASGICEHMAKSLSEDEFLEYNLKYRKMNIFQFPKDGDVELSE